MILEVNLNLELSFILNKQGKLSAFMKLVCVFAYYGAKLSLVLKLRDPHNNKTFIVNFSHFKQSSFHKLETSGSRTVQ